MDETRIPQPPYIFPCPDPVHIIIIIIMIMICSQQSRIVLSVGYQVVFVQSSFVTGCFESWKSQQSNLGPAEMTRLFGPEVASLSH
jgi:hypothetical protein